MSIETLLNDEIRSEFEELKKLEVGTEQYKASVDGLTKLVDRAIEFEKIDAERTEKQLDRGFEEDFKLQQAEENIRSAFDLLKKQRLRVTGQGVQPFNNRLAIMILLRNVSVK